MKVYRLFNKTGARQFVAAPNKATALAISRAGGFFRTAPQRCEEVTKGSWGGFGFEGVDSIGVLAIRHHPDTGKSWFYGIPPKWDGVVLEDE